MKKLLKFTCLLTLLLLVFQCGTLLADKRALHDDVIRLHVVANSDSPADQAQKLLVRDEIMQYLEPISSAVDNKDEAAAYLRARLPELENIANRVLARSGSTLKAAVSLREETFDTRHYDTFSLPAGIYDSLRVEIGSAQGKNWWCVVFPSLCLSVTCEGMQDAAVSAGFDDGLTSTLTGEPGYEVRFFFLDCLGKLENFFKS